MRWKLRSEYDDNAIYLNFRITITVLQVHHEIFADVIIVSDNKLIHDLWNPLDRN